MMLSLIIWLLLSFATAFLAANKNRSFLAWLIIGLLFPVFGIILILVLPDEKSTNTEPATA